MGLIIEYFDPPVNREKFGIDWIWDEPMIKEVECFYKGEWKNRRKDGYGVMECSDGTNYKGYWKNNLY